MRSMKNTINRYFSKTIIITICLIILILSTSIGIIKLKKDIKVIINNDGNKETVNILTFAYKKDLKNILEKNGVIINKKDKVDINLNNIAKDRDIINIKRAVKVTIEMSDENKEVLTTDDSIKDLLQGQGIVLSNLDKVIPGVNESVKNGMVVNITKVDKAIIKNLEKIDYEVVKKEDDTLLEGNEEVAQEGEQGEKEISIEIINENGNKVSEKIIGSETIKEPKDKIVLIGTKKKVEPVKSAPSNLLAVGNGEGNTNDSVPASLSYKNVLTFKATAYYDAGGTGSTASGSPPVRDPNGWSTIAADTSILPMGTKVYVEGYGYAIVQDTGGAIKGNILDLFFNTYDECSRYGKQYGVKVYVLN